MSDETSPSKLCHCGQPLHYANQEMQAAMERMIEQAGGDYVIITIEGRSWVVQRHYIALHGVAARDLLHDGLGFQEITRANSDHRSH